VKGGERRIAVLVQLWAVLGRLQGIYYGSQLFLPNRMQINPTRQLNSPTLLHFIKNVNL